MVTGDPVLVSVRSGSPIVIGGVVPGIASKSVMGVELITLSNHIFAVLVNCVFPGLTFAGLLSRTTVRSISILEPAGSEFRVVGLFSYEKTRCLVLSDKRGCVALTGCLSSHAWLTPRLSVPSGVLA